LGRETRLYIGGKGPELPTSALDDKKQVGRETHRASNLISSNKMGKDDMVIIIIG
jgi:hypothetical protein